MPTPWRTRAHGPDARPPPGPWRSGMPGRPDVPLPPQRMPLVRGGRPLKRWCWVGAFADDLMVCVASARVGPARLSWWALWDRTTRTLHERTTRVPGRVGVGPLVANVRDGRVAISLWIEARAGVETVSPHGAQYAWTRKQGGVRVVGSVDLDGTPRRFEARGIVDESAGYHARDTAWHWSAGVGATPDGAAVAWNLVDGLHDAPEASERTVWIDGTAHEVGPVRFDDDLGGLAFAEGGGLDFTPEAERAHRQRMGPVSSAYVQPFGAFRGVVPVAGELAEGAGVMERHVARW